MTAQMRTKINISAADPRTAPKIQKTFCSKLNEVEVPHCFICTIAQEEKRKTDEEVKKDLELKL